MADYVYTTLTADQRKQIIDSQVAQFEAEHFQHSLNIARAASLPDGDDKDKFMQDAQDAQATILAAITTTQAEEPKHS